MASTVPSATCLVGETTPDSRAANGPAPRFVVDAMLGNVARDLRLVGLDAVYAGRQSDAEILRLCQSERRVLVTRDRELARRAGALPAVLVETPERDAQTGEVLRKLRVNLRGVALLSRCMHCNARLAPILPEEVRARVPDHVALCHGHFVGCPGCGRVYWHGSHSARLSARAERILSSLHRGGARV